MCGIAGAIGNCSDIEIKSMTEALIHRGPDNISYFSKDNLIHLGHTRLSIIDLSSNNHQPMWDRTGRFCIVFNGEIYNFKKIREMLLTKGHKFETNGDTEVLLNLFIEEGSDSLTKLSGIFAFAIWDDFEKSLILARDGYGVKPLYYFHNDEGFYFSSEIKSLLKINKLSKSFNLDAIYRTLIFQWNPGNETILEGVKKLESGTYIKIKNNKIIDSKIFWKYPDYNPTADKVEHHIQNIQKSIEESIIEQLVSDVEIGSLLSGGLDSSLISSIASKYNSKIKCFTINADENMLKKEGIENDLPYAKKVAKFLDLDIDEININPDIVKLLPKVIYHLDELQGDPAAINMFLICMEARSKGIKVLLSGAGGDDIFSGYRRHYAVNKDNFFSIIPRFLLNAFNSIINRINSRNPTFRKVKKFFKYLHLDENERILSYFFWLDPLIAKSLILDQKKLSKNPLDFIYNDLESKNNLNPLEKMLTIEKKYFLKDLNFNYVDKLSMASGVEVRVPFLDKRILDIASKIPSGMKQKGSTGKWILKKASEKYLPKDVIYRKKSGFGAPLRGWIHGDLKQMIDNILSEENIIKRGIFNPDMVKEIILKDRKGNGDYSYTIYTLLCFELWCQSFLD